MKVLGVLTGALAFSEAAKNELDSMSRHQELCRTMGKNSELAHEKCERALSSSLPYAIQQDNYCELKGRLASFYVSPQRAHCKFEVIKKEDGKEYKVFNQFAKFKEE